MLISLENIQCMIDMIVGAKFLTPSGCLINTSFWINNQKSNMSLTWSCTQRSCILVEGKGEVQDSEWQEKLREDRGETLQLKRSFPPTTLSEALWKPIFFLGVLNSLGAPPWPPPKCLLQMFIFINVAYTRQEVGRRMSQRHLRKHFGTLLRKSFQQKAALDGKYSFSYRLAPLPSKSHCNFYLQSEAPWGSKPKILFFLKS